MAYTLNTSHPLYANLVELIGVEGGTLVSLKTPRTFTKHAEASFGTGTYGEHFTSLDGGYTPKGASVSPAIDINTSTTVNYSVFIAINARTSSGGAAGYLAKDTNAYSLCSPAFTAANKVGVFQGYTNKLTGATTVGTGAQSIGVTRAGDGAANGLKLYENGVFDSAATTEYGNAAAGVNYLGGYSGQGSVGASVVWVAVFDKELSAAEILDLHNSLGAGNNFGLVAASAVDGSASGATLGGTSSISAGTAVGSGSASVSGAALAGSSSISAGSASGGGGSGAFTSDAMENNTGAGLLANTAVVWAWYQGTPGIAPTSVVYGSGTTNSSGVLTATGLPSGAGALEVWTVDRTGNYYQPGTVA